MIIRSATLKRLVGLAGIAAVLTVAGSGLGAGIAQAATSHPKPAPNPHVVRVLDRIDQNLDRFAPHSPLDRILDRLTGQ